MAYSSKIKNQAISLRKSGYSINEIVKIIGISKGTASVWMKNITLNKEALRRIDNNRLKAQFKSIQTRIDKRTKVKKKLNSHAYMLYSRLNLNIDLKKVLCAILFWTEGSKNRSCVSFINSDPMMIEVYVSLLRESFNLDEGKFRGLVHLHNYHDEEKIVNFWSKLSGIPVSQFSKSYRKSNTQKRKREGYKGCFRIRYYDSQVAEELHSIYTMLPDFLLGKIGP